MQYEEEGLDEDAKIFVDAIKDHAEDGEWKMGHAVGDDALPERPWRPKTPPPSDKAAIAMTPGDKPLPKQPQPTTALPPAAPGASGSFEVEVSKDGKALPGMLTMGRRTSKVAYRTEDGTTKEIGAVRPRAGSEGAADFRIPEDEPPVSPITALARLSIKNPKKSSNMLVGGMEVGVLDIGRSLCPEGHLPNECTCNDRETVNLAQEIMEQMKTLSRK